MFGNADMMTDGFVSVNIDPSLPQQKLHTNLRRLEVVNAPERLQVG
jgi:hypothetical protein